ERARLPPGSNSVAPKERGRDLSRPSRTRVSGCAGAAKAASLRSPAGAFHAASGLEGTSAQRGSASTRWPPYENRSDASNRPPRAGSVRAARDPGEPVSNRGHYSGSVQTRKRNWWTRREPVGTGLPPCCAISTGCASLLEPNTGHDEESDECWFGQSHGARPCDRVHSENPVRSWL